MWMIDGLLFYLAAMLLPTYFAIGNSLFTPFQASLFSGFVLTAAVWKIEPVAKYMELDLKPKANMVFAYFVVNVAAVWIIARFSMLTGVGIASYFYVIGFATVAYATQYIVTVQAKKK